jgi:NAD(P)-dependent dehydrogenase (short-subunit alcohol dehydrogenase family)
MYAKAAGHFGGVDVLFNNAGIAPPDDVSVLDTSVEAWQRVQDVNLKSVFLCCKHGIPHLLERGGGSVVNTASFVAVMGAATSQISYTASKGGVLALSRELGVEFARRSTPRCSRSCSPRTRRRRPAAWSTCRWAGSRRRPRSPRPPASSPPTTPRISRPARF